MMWWTRDARLTRMSLLVLAAVAAFSLLPARVATASPLYFTGPASFGTVQSEVTVAQAADAALQVLDIDLPVPGLGSVVLTLAGSTTSANPDCSAAPGDPTCLDLRAQIPASLPVSPAPIPSKTTPTTAVSTWTVTNTSGVDLAKAFLVFVSSPGAVSGIPALVGLEPVTGDGYTVINFFDTLFGKIFYAAVDLGPLDASGPGASTTTSVHYVVADGLFPLGGGDFQLPQLDIQAIVVPVPEPGTLTLLAAGLLGLVVSRRLRCA